MKKKNGRLNNQESIKTTQSCIWELALIETYLNDLGKLRPRGERMQADLFVCLTIFSVLWLRDVGLRNRRHEQVRNGLPNHKSSRPLSYFLKYS